MRQRGVQVPGFGGNALLTVNREELQRPHIMQTVRELDQDDAGVLGNGQQQLAIVLDLPVLRRVERQVADLRQAIDDLGDFLTELGLDVVNGDRRIFDDVVNQPARDGRRIQLKVHEDLRDFDAMRDVLVPRESLLAYVRLLAEPIGAREQLPVEALRKPLLKPRWKCLLVLDRACRHNSPASAKLI